MEASEKKHLIISLIKDDLVYNKLVNGLTNLGLDAMNYHLHLSETIFKLLGFGDDQKSDSVFEYYMSQLKHSLYINIENSHEELEVMAEDLFAKLERKAEKLKHEVMLTIA